MSESLSTVGAITMFIEDTQRSKVFYEQVFGAKAVYEDANAVAFNFENMNRVGVAPCQWFSPGSKKTQSPGRITSTGPPSL